MEILQLKYFCNAAETQNFSQTAAHFMVPTSNISQSVKRLETELGTKLFDRNINCLRLNEKGQLFYGFVREALDLLEHAKQTACEGDLVETVSIGTLVNHRVVMDVIELFKKKYPNAKVNICRMTDERFNDCDLITTDKSVDMLYIKKGELRERLLLAYNPDVFRFPDTITGEDLKNCPFVAMSIDKILYNALQSVGEDMGFSPHIVLQSVDPFYIYQCIEKGIGIAIVPEITWRRRNVENVMLKSLGNYYRKTYLYQKPGRNAYVDKFCQMLIDEFRKNDCSSVETEDFADKV